MESQCEQKVNKIHEEATKIQESLRSKIFSLEKEILELEKERSELKSQVLHERARADDEISAVFQKFRAKEVVTILSLSRVHSMSYKCRILLVLSKYVQFVLSVGKFFFK